MTALDPAHPRVGGENSVVVAVFIVRSGSSPRGRGKLGLNLTLTRGLRLIPAWAGKTSASSRATRFRRAHPRVGGENAPIVSVLPFSQGSSPRGRGKLPSYCVHVNPNGLIPAWAGKTESNWSAVAHARAHPRVGGENLLSGSKRT